MCHVKMALDPYVPLTLNVQGVAAVLIKHVVVAPGAVFGSVIVNAAPVPSPWLISSSVELFVQRTRIAVDREPSKFGATLYVMVVSPVPLPPLTIETNGARLSELKLQFSPEVRVTT